jgi:Gpi18-like mannosyltransferase
MALTSLPALKNFFSMDAALMGFLFVLLTMPHVMRVTGGYFSGSIQLFVHGMILFYLFVWLQSGLPTTRVFGLNSGPAITAL